MHPLTQYALATQRIADDQRQAQLERMARQAREGRVTHVDRAPFRDRLRLLIDRTRRYRTTVPLAALALVATTVISFGGASAADPASDPTSIDRGSANLSVGGYPVPTPDVSFGKIRVSSGWLPATPSGAGPSFDEYQTFLLARHAAGLAPTFRQQQAFLREEHGYAVIPTFEQRQAFLMEEHGYTTGAR
jgi:hypothetical protein